MFIPVRRCVAQVRASRCSFHGVLLGTVGEKVKDFGPFGICQSHFELLSSVPTGLSAKCHVKVQAGYKPEIDHKGSGVVKSTCRPSFLHARRLAALSSLRSPCSLQGCGSHNPCPYSSNRHRSPLKTSTARVGWTRIKADSSYRTLGFWTYESGPGTLF